MKRVRGFFDQNFEIIWICLAFIVLGSVVVVPVLNVIYESFFIEHTEFGGEVVREFVGFQNYQNAFKDPYFWRFFKQNVIYTAGSVGLSLIVGFICALLLHQITRLKSFFRGALLIPWVIPPVVAALLWRWMLNDSFGLVNHMIAPFADQVNWLGEPKLAMLSLIVVDSWKRIPIVMIFVLAGLKSIPLRLYEVAKVDGAGPIQQFRHITLPLLRPVLSSVILIVSIFVFRTYTIIGGLTGGGPARNTDTLTSFIFTNLVEYREIGYSSALSVIVLFVIILYALFFLTLFYRRREG